MNLFPVFFLSVLLSVLPLSSVQAAQPLRIVCDEWPPYQIVDQQGVRGFSTEVIKHVFQRLGVSIQPIEAYPWKRAMNMLKSGEADALFSANFTQQRTEFAWYPEESLVNSPWVMWVRKGEGLSFETLADLNGKRLGMVQGYSYTPELWKYVREKKEFEEASSDLVNFKKLSMGRLDYVPAELGNGLYLTKKMGFDNLVPLRAHPVKSDGLYIMFNKDRVDASLANAFSEELKKMKETDEYRLLYKKYFE